MRIKAQHAPFIARKIAYELLKCGFVSLKNGGDEITQIATDIILKDINAERAIEERANELMDDNEGDIEFMQVDRRAMFGMIKKKLASEMGFELNQDERYSHISHDILNTAWKKDALEYNVSENRVKNVIYSAIEGYLKNFEKAQRAAFDELEGKEKLAYGSPEYELAFEKAYEEQLRKHGIIG